MKLSKKSWHYRFMLWAMGYPPERNILITHWDGKVYSDEPRGVVSYWANLTTHLLGLPLILSMRGLARVVGWADDWMKTHKVELEENHQAKSA